MNNRILVAGGTIFEREYLRDGQYHISGKKYLGKLYKSFMIDNLSKDHLTSYEALKLVKAFSNEFEYSHCILALGEGDIEEKISLVDFKENLVEIISLLKEKGLNPVLFSLPIEIERTNKEYQIVINELRKNYELDSIFNTNDAYMLSMAK